MQPKQNGMEFLKELKSETKWKKIPFIMFTNINVPEARIEAKALGANKYLLKTEITPEALVKEMDEVLQNKGVQEDKDDSLKEIILTELHGQLMKSVKGLVRKGRTEIDPYN